MVVVVSGSVVIAAAALKRVPSADTAMVAAVTALVAPVLRTMTVQLVQPLMGMSIASGVAATSVRVAENC